MGIRDEKCLLEENSKGLIRMEKNREGNVVIGMAYLKSEKTWLRNINKK